MCHQAANHRPGVGGHFIASSLEAVAIPSAQFEFADRDTVEYLLARHYRPPGRPLRRCHPRDLLLQVQNYCNYNGLPLELTPAYFDLVVENYFTVVGES